MTVEPELLLVGERDLLATISSPSGGAATLPRPVGADPLETAARALTSEPGLVVVFRPQSGELEALRQAGLDACEWPHDWLPVADELFSEDEPRPERRKVFFTGAASERRDGFLQPVKHRFDVLHLAGGADLAELSGLMGRCTTAIDLAPEPGLAEVDRVGPAMAAGLLVLSEKGSGRTGLEDWQELVRFSTPDELSLVIGDALRDPEPFLGVRRRGRAEAEKWRSSVALPRFVAERVD